jgi:hypothetical protein
VFKQDIGAAPIAKTKGSNVTLQSITARYRIADLADTGRSLFRLGFKVVAKLNIELRKVEEAGLDAVVDLDTWWTDPAWRHRTTDAYEEAVPRVSLLHQ